MNKIERRFKQLISLSLGLLRAPFLASRYHIKKGYRHRNKYAHFSAIGAKDQGQKEVYQLAAQMARKNKFRKIIDVGCGSAFKLLREFEGLDFQGIEIGKTYQHLLEKYPDQQWLDGETVNYAQLEAEMVVCSDVIEHVLDPDDLLSKIKSIQGLQCLAISTPDRLLARGWFDYGPPANPTHQREWNGHEFASYLESQGLEIISQQITKYTESTQMLFCRPRNVNRKL